jgi:hypothetical protein
MSRSRQRALSPSRWDENLADEKKEKLGIAGLCYSTFAIYVSTKLANRPALVEIHRARWFLGKRKQPLGRFMLQLRVPNFGIPDA